MNSHLTPVTGAKLLELAQLPIFEFRDSAHDMSHGWVRHPSRPEVFAYADIAAGIQYWRHGETIYATTVFPEHPAETREEVIAAFHELIDS